MDSNIVNNEAAALAREVARRSGMPIDEIILLALQNYAQKMPGMQSNELEKARILSKIDEIANRCAALPTLDPRHPDAILYDAQGLPK